MVDVWRGPGVDMVGFGVGLKPNEATAIEVSGLFSMDDSVRLGDFFVWGAWVGCGGGRRLAGRRIGAGRVIFMSSGMTVPWGISVFRVSC